MSTDLSIATVVSDRSATAFGEIDTAALESTEQSVPDIQKRQAHIICDPQFLGLVGVPTLI